MEQIKVEAAAKMLGVRIEVAKFALLMEAKLAKYDHERGRQGWKDAAPGYLADRMWAEFHELDEARRSCQLEGGPAEVVAEEAADVANFAMMVADVVGGLK